ncbi:hypothetical protein ACFS5J_03250 [Flavobacterium chuncheonense]|uniref:Uncharacterized protein n=1 Tax=Flavobacterium chuncheonense TaxID=2026653 RepID=A0ABW5YIY4_9FLAO
MSKHNLKLYSEGITILNVFSYLSIATAKDFKNDLLITIPLFLLFINLIAYIALFTSFKKEPRITTFTLIYQPLFIVFFCYYGLYKLGLV